ncbi:glycoside hydrolase family 97 protein [Flavivirga eckloniae]|uniref:Alpha-glucosidase n=1 Tax=Flavivirga eckloniae TaxID=1803846 RepID=A0A2K9PSN5_9FLAO|nr:glycoside hydrolase family 97 protein [Flavivirga eckloniae]AUP80080.1 alpha-glucosidase [Flavivirga eckloniae]
MQIIKYNKVKIGLYVLIGCLLVTSCAENNMEQVIIPSPNGKLKVHFNLKSTKPTYHVHFNNKQVIDTSIFGLEFKNQANLTSNFKIVGVIENEVNENWTQVWGEKKEINNHYNHSIIKLQEIDGLKRHMNINFKVYNDGLGFSYTIPEQESVDSLSITNELTEFNLAQNYSTWYTPANFDSYEMAYQNKPANEVESANTPVTFEALKDSIFISIHEANLTNYAGMTLRKDKDSKLKFQADLVPWPDGVKVKTKTPMNTPWRTIQISNTAGGLIESCLILNLNEPNKLQDVSWIKPLKYIGIWWGMHLGTQTWTLGDRHGATTERMKAYIDFAAENNIDAVLAEGWSTGWEDWGKAKAFDFVTPYEDFDLEALSKYAKDKKIKLIGHHETGGDALYYEQQMDKAFGLYKSLGIHDVKTGYAGPINPSRQLHHGQFMVNHYRKVVETAAKYKLTINAHEPIKPTGIRRTYPNMMSREGARGMEWNAWSEGNSPEHHVTLPFTRILAGPLDYTPGIFDLLYKNAKGRVKWNGLDKGNSRINTTLSKQLALYVVLYSPLQMASDNIDNYRNEPAFQFIKDVPVDWEDTKVLQAKIGDYLAIARKDINSNDWYLGAATDENRCDLEINLDFLDSNKAYVAEIYADTEQSDWKTNPYEHQILKKEVSSKDTLTLKLAPGGGQAIRFKTIPK